MSTMEFYDCPNCSAKRVLPMSDGRCPNCKSELIKEEKVTESSDIYIKSNDKVLLCKGCGKPLRQFQIDTIGDSNYSDWWREGFCSYSCHEENIELSPIDPATTSAISYTPISDISYASNSDISYTSTSKVVFRESDRITFPNICIGCSDEKAGERLKYWIFTRPRFYAARKAFGQFNLFISTIQGGIGGFAGASTLNARIKESNAVILHTIHVCKKCISKLSSKDIKKLAEPSDELFSKNGIGNDLFAIMMSKGCIVMTRGHTGYFQAMLELNPGLVFTSLEECLDSSQGLEVSSLGNQKRPRRLPWIDNKKLQEYETTYARKLSETEAAIVDSWHNKVSGNLSIDTYPNIKTKKINNAKAVHKKTNDELILGLHDSTSFRSGKKAELFTSNAVYFKPKGSIEPIRLDYASIDTSEFFSKKYIELYADHRFELRIPDTFTRIAILSFLWEASRFVRSDTKAPI